MVKDKRTILLEVETKPWDFNKTDNLDFFIQTQILLFDIAVSYSLNAIKRT